jgi:hypothetical protein
MPDLQWLLPFCNSPANFRTITLVLSRVIWSYTCILKKCYLFSWGWLGINPPPLPRTLCMPGDTWPWSYIPNPCFFKISLPVYPRLASNSQFFCLHLLSCWD